MSLLLTLPEDFDCNICLCIIIIFFYKAVSVMSVKYTDVLFCDCTDVNRK